MGGRVRLDTLLVDRGLYRSRARARDAVLRGAISVDGAIERRPGVSVSADAVLAQDDPAAGYVSRAALKLKAGLATFGYDAAGCIALDVGASTGGFTQVLLEAGAARVYAVDVGHGQFSETLQDDPRVVLLEQTDARVIDAELVPDPVTAIVSDVSFISLKLALPSALARAASGCWLIALIKPQFEVGRDGVGKGGIVRDPALRETAIADLRQWLNAQPGWQVDDVIPSPVTGGDGNVEYLLGARFRPSEV